MICVTVSADEQDNPFLERMRVILEEYFPLISISGHMLDTCCPAGARFVLTDAESFTQIKSERQIIIFKGITKVDMKKLTSGSAIAIVDSSDKDLLPFVSSTGLPAITCGLSPKDTITLSSIGTDSAVITLGRSVKCFDGTIVEPQEIPVRLTPDEDRFLLMAVAAIFILSGNIDRLLQTRFL